MVRSVAVPVVPFVTCSLLAAPTPTEASQHPAEACPDNLPPADFDDVTGGVHAHAIDCVAWWEIAHGDGRGHYGPGADVRRDQIASMLTRLLAAVERAPEPAGDQGFGDVAGNVHADNVNALAVMGVVRGVTPTRFAPGNPVRRDQMASLLVRLHEVHFGPLPAGQERFEDTVGNVHAEAIDKLAAAGVAMGHAETAYEPARR